LAQLFRPDKYFKPKSLEETQLLLKQYGRDARMLAGGTDLLVQKPSSVKYVIDLKGLPLDYIRGNPDGISIGATTTFSHILESPLMHTSPYNVLTDSARQLGHRNIRNLATIGGNICNAVPSADAPPALIALDAEAVVITDGYLPPQSGRVGASFMKLSRTRVDIALVNVASKVTLDKQNVCTEARIVLGAVAPTPLRSREAENSLLGKEITDEIVAKAAQYASEKAKPISDIRASKEYRQEMVKVLTKRAITEANKRAKEAY